MKLSILQRYLNWRKYKKLTNTLKSIIEISDLLNMHNIGNSSDLRDIEFSSMTYAEPDQRTVQNIEFKINQYKWHISRSITSFGNYNNTISLQYSNELMANMMIMIFDNDTSLDINIKLVDHVIDVNKKLLGIYNTLRVPSQQSKMIADHL